MSEEDEMKCRRFGLTDTDDMNDREFSSIVICCCSGEGLSFLFLTSRHELVS